MSKLARNYYTYSAKKQKYVLHVLLVLVILVSKQGTIYSSVLQLRDTTDDLGSGSRVLSSMLLRAAANRAVLALVAAAVLVVMGVVVYVAVFS